MATHCIERLTEEPSIGGEQATWLLQDPDSVMQRLTSTGLFVAPRSSVIERRFTYSHQIAFLNTELMSYSNWRIQRSHEPDGLRHSRLSGAELSPSAGYALLVYADLLAMVASGAKRRRKGFASGMNPFTASLESTAPLAETLFSHGEVLVTWPIPPTETFWEFSVLMSRWQLLTQRFKSASAAVFGWLELGASFLPNNQKPLLISESEPTLDDWRRLFLDRLAPPAFRSEYFGWIGRASVLISPIHMGVNPELYETLREVMTSMGLYDYFKSSRDSFHRTIREHGWPSLADWAADNDIFADQKRRGLRRRDEGKE